MSKPQDDIGDYLRDDYDEHLKGGSLGKALVVSYYLDQYRASFRIRAKELYAEALEAEASDGASQKAWCALLLFLVDCLLDDDRLRGKAGKCQPLAESAELNMFDALLGPVEGESSGAASAEGMTKAKLQKVRQALRGKDGERRRDAVPPDSTLRLLRAMLRVDARNKNFTAAQRLMELEADTRIAAKAAPLEDLDEHELEQRRQEDSKKCVACFNKKSAWATELRGYLTFDRQANTARWWREVFEDRPEAFANRSEVFVTYAAAMVARESLDNHKTGRAKTWPPDLMRLYRARREESTDSGDVLLNDNEAKADAVSLVRGMQEDAYREAVIPLAIDAKTGGGLFVVGQAQAKALPMDPTELGAWQSPIVLVDYNLGSPLFLSDTVREKMPDMGQAVHHRCRVVLADKISVRPTPTLIEKALGALLGHYEHNKRRAHEDSFWDSYVSNGSLQKMPEGCPERYRAYFGDYADEKPAKAQAASGPDLRPDLSSGSENFVVLPYCVMRYLQKERKTELVVRWFEAADVVQGKAPLSHEKAMEELKARFWNERGIADYLPCVAQGRYSREKWSNILATVLRSPGFEIYYLDYVSKHVASMMPSDDWAKAQQWLEDGKVQMRSRGRLSALEKDWALEHGA